MNRPSATVKQQRRRHQERFAPGTVIKDENERIICRIDKFEPGDDAHLSPAQQSKSSQQPTIAETQARNWTIQDFFEGQRLPTLRMRLKWREHRFNRWHAKACPTRGRGR